MSGAMLDAALEYAHRGIPVFPLVPNGKTPLTAHGFKDATTGEAQIKAWWTATPDANIGMPTGLVTRRSVVDEDNKPWKGATGSQTMESLTTIHGPLPETLWQTTWSGGKQTIFAYNPEAVNSAHSYGAFVDGRNDGGYIAVPPSHVVEGDRKGTYAWNADPFTTPLATMPDWLVERGRGGPYSPGAEKKAGTGKGKRKNAPGLGRCPYRRRRRGLARRYGHQADRPLLADAPAAVARRDRALHAGVGGGL